MCCYIIFAVPHSEDVVPKTERSSKKERTHVQGWGWLCVLGEKRAARSQVTLSPGQRWVNLGQFPRTDTYKTPR